MLNCVQRQAFLTKGEADPRWQRSVKLPAFFFRYEVFLSRIDMAWACGFHQDTQTTKVKSRDAKSTHTVCNFPDLAGYPIVIVVSHCL